MNWERVEGNWKDFQGKMLQQWSKLTNDDLNQVKGRRDMLLGKLQERYGIAREAAERQIEDWMRNVGEQGAAGLRAAESFQGAYEHWFERMMDVQRQSIELMSERMRKAMELPARFAECRNPADLAKYVTTVLHGLAVQAAGGATRAQLVRVVTIALRSWPTAG